MKNVGKNILLVISLLLGNIIFFSIATTNEGEVSALSYCCGQGCGGCYSANPCGVGNCTTWVSCNTSVPNCQYATTNSTGSAWWCYQAYPGGSCQSPTGGGSSPGDTTVDNCTGVNPECRTGITNCGSIGKVAGTGSCSNGGLCCAEPPPSPPPACPYDPGSGLGPSYGGQWANSPRSWGYYCGYCPATGGSFEQRGDFNRVAGNGICYNDYSPIYSCSPDGTSATVLWNRVPTPYHFNVGFYQTSSGPGPAVDISATNGSILAGSIAPLPNPTFNMNFTSTQHRGNFTGLTPNTNYTFTVRAANIYSSVFRLDSSSGNITFSCPPNCSATAPNAFNLISPINGVTIATHTTAALSWEQSLWGSGCPVNNNQYTIFTSASPTGPWTNRGTSTTETFNLTGLTAGTLYYWYVSKSNGSQSVNSAVQSFRTNSYPQIFYDGQILTDVCGQGTSGRFGPGNVTNPIRMQFGVYDFDGDTPRALQIALVPRSLSGGVASSTSATLHNWISTSGGLRMLAAIDNPNPTATLQYVQSYDPTTGIWTGTGSGEHQVRTSSSVVATMLDIRGATGTNAARTSSQNSSWYFRTRLENIFGQGAMASNPTRIWDIYAFADMRNSDGNLYGNPTWTRMGQWGVDMTPPSSSISGPSYDVSGNFNITYTASDLQGVLGVNNFVLRSDGAATLTDNTLGQALSFTGNQHSGSVNSSNYTPITTRNYSTNGIPGNNFTFSYNVQDYGCNLSVSSLNSGSPSPWILTTDGNVSVNGNTINNGGSTNIPFPTSFVSAVTNVAQGKPATQISTLSGADASRAVDGVTNGNWSVGSVSHSNTTNQDWWQVDLGQVYNITSINVFNRTDCCGARLSNYYIFVSDVPFGSTSLSATLSQSGVSSYFNANQAGTPSTQVVNRTGRYVRIQLNGAVYQSDYLALAEVQVLGSSSNTFSLTGIPSYTYNDGTNGPFFNRAAVMSGTVQTIVSPINRVSRLNKYATQYINEAVNPRNGVSWYNHLLPTVQRNNISPMINFSTTNEVATGITQIPVAQTYGGNLSALFGIAVNGKANVNLTGNVIFNPNTICNIKSIIFVSGNLRLLPNFATTAGNGCMFVVQGTISIGTGTDGSLIPLNSPTQPYYDIIGAGLVSDNQIWVDNNPRGTTVTSPQNHWRFDESAGNNVSDSVGGQTGVWSGTGTPRWVTGRYGNAGNFNGINDAVNLGVKNFGTDFTISGWFKVDTATGNMDILSALAGGHSHGVLVEINRNVNPNNLRFLYRSPVGVSGGQNLYSTTTIGLNTWYYFAAVKSGSIVRLFVNGNLEATVNLGSAELNPLGNLNVHLGKLLLSDNQRNFDGQIDDLKFYSTALSPEQVLQEYTIGSLTTSNKGEGILLRGPVVSGGSFEWNRDLFSTTNALYPAVIVNHNVNLFNFFRSDLWVREYSIRESQ